MTSPTIQDVRCWEALDSRGRPTVGCAITLTSGATGRVIAPSGASTGAHEAKELRDGGSRYGGYGVRTAVAHVLDELRPAVLGHDATDQAGIDAVIEQIDGSDKFARLGGNAALGLSLAAYRAATVHGQLFRYPGPSRESRDPTASPADADVQHRLRGRPCSRSDRRPRCPGHPDRGCHDG